MDPKLAEIYGTSQNTEADLEKLAAAELANQLAGGEEQTEEQPEMTEDDLEAIAQEVLGAATEEAPAVEEQEKTSAAEEAKEKVAEADYLGRVMAHAYVQELRELEAGETEKTAAYHKGAIEGIKAGIKGVGSTGRELHGAKRAKALGKGLAKFLPHAAGAAAVGVGAKKLHTRHKEKKEQEKTSAAEPELSAVDSLVLLRAQEILAQSNIDPDSLTPVGEPEQEKTSAEEPQEIDPRQVLAETVEQRAWNFLSQYGVIPNTEEK